MTISQGYEKIQLLEAVGISVQTSHSGIQYFPGQAIGEDSPAIDSAADMIYGLLEKYAALDGLVRHKLRTPRAASDELISQLRSARDDAREWGQRANDDDSKYAARRIDDLITGELTKCGAE